MARFDGRTRAFAVDEGGVKMEYVTGAGEEAKISDGSSSCTIGPINIYWAPSSPGQVSARFCAILEKRGSGRAVGELWSWTPRDDSYGLT